MSRRSAADASLEEAGGGAGETPTPPRSLAIRIGQLGSHEFSEPVSHVTFGEYTQPMNSLPATRPKIQKFP